MVRRRGLKCTEREENRSILDDVFKKHMCHKDSEQNEKRNNKLCGCELSVLERIERNVLK